MANIRSTKGPFVWRTSALPALAIILPGLSRKQDKLGLNYISVCTKAPFAYD